MTSTHDPAIRVTDPPPPARSGGFLGTVLGGVLAAAAGAAATLYVLPEGWNGRAASTSEIALLGSVKTQGDDLAALKKDIAALRAELEGNRQTAAEGEGGLETLKSDVGTLSTRLDDIGTRLDGIETRLTTMEERPLPMVSSDDGTAGPSAGDLARMQALIEAQKAEAADIEARLAKVASDAEARIGAAQSEAERVEADAQELARQTRARAALIHLRAALESGGPIQSALDDLGAAGIDVPSALTEQAGGIPSLDALKESFPPAARDALTISLRETAGTGMTDRLWAFMRSETGARSLTPRAGDDPDAVLSRAEAALRAGDVATAISELAALPEGGRARMSEWIGLAERRLAAVDAVTGLAATLN